MKSIQEIVRYQEDNYRDETVKLSKYVDYSQYETIERIKAYLNSKHLSGEYDSKGREKPFLDIVTSAVNIWFRATDIDRSDIKIRATKEEDFIKSLIATVKIQEWMRKSNFGVFLNNWGRILSRYGSAIVKVVENSDGLHLMVLDWGKVICDPIDITQAPIIEKLELTPAELSKRVETHNYNQEEVKKLLEDDGILRARQTMGGEDKDNDDRFIQVYEVHGLLSKQYITDKEEDEFKFTEQIHIVSFLENEKVGEFNEYSLFSGEEEKTPYILTHLLEEDDRALAIGAVEHLFETQWMQNHSMKAVKDQLDLASKLLFQTSDATFLGRNALNEVDTGDILIHTANQPLTQVNNQTHDTGAWTNFRGEWKTAGNEMVGISESMKGATPKSGTAWRQTEAVLQQGQSLFEIMTENKGLALENIFKTYIIPFIKRTELDTSEEITAVLEGQNIEKIDSRYIKAETIRRSNKEKIESVLETGFAEEPDKLEIENGIRSEMSDLGNQRFFKPSELSDLTWKKYFKDMEWNLEIDITGEQRNIQEDMQTLQTTLQVIANPDFATNKQAQAVVARVLELTGAMSPIEFANLPQQPQPTQQVEAGSGVPDLSDKTKQ